MVTIDVRDAPTRIEHLIWNRSSLTPAAKAFLAELTLTIDDDHPAG